MVQSIVMLTREGARDLEAELQYLRNVRRPELAAELASILGDGGNLEESAEFAQIKDEQAFVEGRIIDLELILEQAHILEDQYYEASDTIRLNSIVTVQENDAPPMILRIVGSVEAKPSAGKISDVSPLGKALIGKRAGDSVTITVPDGNLTYSILSIQ